MNASRTLSLYVAREIALFTELGFAAVGCVLLGDQLLSRLGEMVTIGLTRAETLSLLSWILTLIAAPALPLAFAFGSLLAILRLASDLELMALRASGISPTSLLRPALAVGLVVSVVTAWLVLDREPAARLAMRNTFTEIALRGSIIQSGKVRGVGDRMVYVDERTRDNRLSGVVIYDGSQAENSYLVVAPRGELLPDAERQALTLALEQGEIHLDPDGNEPERIAMIAFDRLRYRIDAASLLHFKAFRLKPEELSLAKIAETLERIDRGLPIADMRWSERSVYAAEWHRRWALVPVPLLFALLSVPLGIVLRRGRRSLGVLYCALATAGYYALLGAGRSLAEDGVVGIALGCWGPNLLLLVTALFLLRRARKGFSR